MLIRNCKLAFLPLLGSEYSWFRFSFTKLYISFISFVYSFLLFLFASVCFAFPSRESLLLVVSPQVLCVSFPMYQTAILFFGPCFTPTPLV